MGKFCLATSGHGGNCCGIDHLFAFDDVDLDDIPEISFLDKIEVIQDYIESLMGAHGAPYGEDKQLCIEVVLADYQWKDWERALPRCGFRRKFEFHNSNSNNRCRIYFLATNQPKPIKQIPLRSS